MYSEKHSVSLIELVRNYRATTSSTVDSIFDFFSSLNSPRSLTCWILFREKEYQQLLDLEVNPEHYNSAFGFRDAHAATSFLSKASFLKLDVSKSDAALLKFFEFEKLCAETNSRFRNLAVDPLHNEVNASLLHATAFKISSILGDFRPEEWVEESNWGPGVTTLLKGSEVSAVNKFHSESGITRDLYSLVGDWFPAAYPLWHAHLLRTAQEKSTPRETDHWFPTAYPLWSAHLTCISQEHWADYQRGNSIVTVSKNSKTDRVIAVEPGLNLWFQKGLGAMIRRRLLRRGVDLTKQTKNQLLAKRASHDDSLATVDFSSASDSISREVVRALIPEGWFTFLDCTRSKLGIHNEEVIRWNKFSSMGNGYTFELESLIFYAAAQAVCDHLRVTPEVSVYGDDVLLPVDCYELFSSFSAFLGFRVNKRKSFSSGCFRESCGGHYFDGVDVKPIYLKDRVDNVQAIYKLANSVRNLANRRNSHYGCDARFHRCWRNLFRRVPKPLRLGVSRGLGNCGFSVNFDEATPTRAGRGFEGYRCLAMLALGKTRESDSPAVLLARLKVPSIQEYGNNYTLRGRTKTKFKQVLVPQWYNYGPWF